MKEGDVVGSIRTLERTRTHPDCEGCPKKMCNPPQCKGYPFQTETCQEKPLASSVFNGKQVWTDTEMEALRLTRCLCLRCGRLKRLSACRSAKDLLELCRSTNIALMVTRCPRFVAKGG